eukprot:jgi/Ulvmu1/1034/UM104_0019.1
MWAHGIDLSIYTSVGLAIFRSIWLPLLIIMCVCSHVLQCVLHCGRSRPHQRRGNKARNRINRTWHAGASVQDESVISICVGKQEPCAAYSTAWKIMMKCLILCLVGALLPAANAQAAGGTSLCTISNIVNTASLSGSDFTNAVVGIGGFVCEDDESNIGTQIAVVASSIMDMLSDVDISCLLLEDNAALEQITSQAERGAGAAGLAIGAVMSSEEVCVDCVAKAELFVDEVVLQVREAVLAVFSQLDLALTRLEIRRAIRRGLERALDDAISGASLTVRNAAVSNCGGSGTIVRRVR